jgi:hypothetical protein
MKTSEVLALPVGTVVSVISFNYRYRNTDNPITYWAPHNTVEVKLVSHAKFIKTDAVSSTEDHPYFVAASTSSFGFKVQMPNGTYRIVAPNRIIATLDDYNLTWAQVKAEQQEAQEKQARLNVIRATAEEDARQRRDHVEETIRKNLTTLLGEFETSGHAHRYINIRVDGEWGKADDGSEVFTARPQGYVQMDIRDLMKLFRKLA